MVLLVLIILMLLVESWLERGGIKSMFMTAMAINTIIVLSAFYIIIDQTNGALNFISYLLTVLLVVKTIGDFLAFRGSTKKRIG